MAVKITSEKELEAWLEDKPSEWAQVIGLLCSLRVLPLIFQRDLYANETITPALPLATFRSNVIVLGYLKNPPAAPFPEPHVSAWTASIEATDAAGEYGPVPPRLTAYEVGEAAFFASYAIFNAPRENAAKNTLMTVSHSLGAVNSSRLFKDLPFWEAISFDCEGFAAQFDSEPLHDSMLWPRGSSDWDAVWDEARKWLSASGHGFKIWREWYHGRLEGLPHAFANFDDAADKEFYRWIVEKEDEWWNRDAAEVNAEITEFVDSLRKPKDEPPVDFFISHASGDKAALSDLLSVLDDLGKTYTIPVRDGSEARSDKAIERADKVIALYSENYFQSKQCEDEWLHAYMLDVNTAEQRMLAFRLDRADLKPMMNGLSFCDLTRLLPDRRKQAMAKWIEWKPRPHIRDNVEQTLTTNLDPGVVASEDGKLDTAPDVALNTAELPSQLAQAMEALRMMLDLARQTERNLSSMMQGTLKLYDDHFTENGRDSSWRGLDRYIKVLSEGAADLSAATMREEKAALEQLIAAHGECIDALASADEQNRELANIPVPNDDPGAIGSLIDQLSDVQEQAHNLDASTDKYDSEARGLVAQGRDFAFEAGAPDAAQKPDAARKSFLRYVGGFGMKTLTVLGSLATLRSTPEGKKLIDAAKSLVEKFYEMIGL